jgi:hypothetical protein
LRPDSSEYQVSDYAKQNYDSSFVTINMLLHDLFASPRPLSKAEFFTSEFNIVVTRFIAWAYTYHYLNWFSKTSIIGWHQISRLRLSAVLCIWLASVVIYAVNYSLGFKWLFLLSFAHVCLEFPLNHRSFIGIGSELVSWVHPRQVVPATTVAASVGADRRKRSQQLIRRRK